MKHLTRLHAQIHLHHIEDHNLRKFGTYPVQLAARNSGEVVMFHMVANIPGQKVERAIVRIGLLSLQKHVVLCNEVASNRMHSPSKKCGKDQVYQSLPP